MARFDVYESLDSDSYLLDVQSDLLDGFNTRVVVPLLPRDQSPRPAKRLNPIFAGVGADLVMATQYLASVPEKELKSPVGNLAECAHEISTAIDMLFVGF